MCVCFQHCIYEIGRFSSMIARRDCDVKRTDVGLICRNVEEVGNVGDQLSRMVHTTKRSTDQMRNRDGGIQEENKSGLVTEQQESTSQLLHYIRRMRAHCRTINKWQFGN